MGGVSGLDTEPASNLSFFVEYEEVGRRKLESLITEQSRNRWTNSCGSHRQFVGRYFPEILQCFYNPLNRIIDREKPRVRSNKFATQPF